MSGSALLAMFITLLGIGISVLGRGEHHKVSLKLPLNGVLFAIGAAMCQGIGLVLSKIGMDHYQATADMPEWLVPFSANFYRCVALSSSSHHHLRTVYRCGLLADGCSVHSCWHCLYIDGHDAHYHPAAILLAL